MARGTWDDFFPYVAPWAPSAPAEIMRNFLREGAIKLCRFAHVLEDDMVPMTTAPSKQEYVITQYATDEEVDTVVNVLINGIKISPATMSYLDRAIPLWTTQTGNSVIHYTQGADSSILLVYIPTQAGTPNNIKIRATVRPTRTSTSVNADLLSTYHEAISEWAKHRLLSMPPKVAKWSDRTGAADALIAWKRASQNAFWKKQRSNTDSDLVASPAVSFGTEHHQPLGGR